MLKLTNLVRHLKKEREQTRRRLEQLNSALQALSGLGGQSGLNRGTMRSHAVSGKRRTMSAAARKRIAAAQRARWAKWKAAQKKKS
jgi:hypothetical protein